MGWACGSLVSKTGPARLQGSTTRPWPWPEACGPHLAGSSRVTFLFFPQAEESR